MTQGRPVQIISIDSEESANSFILNEDNLEQVIAKIPKDLKVSVISVVGAFRSGKSFLLNFFLRYLRHGSTDDLSEDWMLKDGQALSEGNLNKGTIKSDDESSSASFAWRGGQERQTTGIWMWSEPFIRKCKDTDQNMAVILMDTQGLFDNETSMALTAQIFGLSTFVSSYQIYNIDKRLQEDNLQHLALFSEYGRLALNSDGTSNSNVAIDKLKENVQKMIPEITETKCISSEVSHDESQPEPKEQNENTEDETLPTNYRHHTSVSKPFQRVQFLVRDWQNFSCDWPEPEEDAIDDFEERNKVYAVLKSEMKSYLESVIKPRGLDDLQSTRDQIMRCFESIDCYLLPHPGAAVTKKSYDGSISQIDPFFRAMINYYVRDVFDKSLEIKVINGRQISGRELQTYFQVYVRTFQTSSRTFPKAMTLLDATAEANNRNALQQALDSYKAVLSAIVSDNSKGFQPETELLNIHTVTEKDVLYKFDELASLGSESSIQEFRVKLEKELKTEWARFRQTNRLKNPFIELEQYKLPVAVATAGWILATLLDQICTSDRCEFVEDTFERLYMFAAFGILVFAYTQNVRDAHMYTIPLGIAALSWFVAAVISTSCTTESCVKAGSAFQRVYLFIGFAVIVLAYKNYSTAFSYIQQIVLTSDSGSNVTNRNEKKSG